jgi:hypothetical protein
MFYFFQNRNNFCSTFFKSRKIEIIFALLFLKVEKVEKVEKIEILFYKNNKCMNLIKQQTF